MRTQIDLLGVAAHARRFNLLEVTVPQMETLIKGLRRHAAAGGHDVMELLYQLRFALAMAAYQETPAADRDPLTGESSWPN